MAVYFVYRCPYNGPTEKHVKRFEDATVLDWFRRIWEPVPEAEAWPHAERLLGTNVYSFGSLFMRVHDDRLLLPATIDDAVAGVTAMYGGPVKYEEHCVQFLTDDDELTMCWYLFDDVFLAEHPGLAAYLLHEGERLPDGAGPGGWEPAVKTVAGWPEGDGDGFVISGHLSPSDDCNLADLTDGVVQRHRGLRVADVCRTVMTAEPADEEVFRGAALREALFTADLVDDETERAFLRAIREAPGDAVNWMAYSDWLTERGLPPAGLRLLEAALGRMYGDARDRAYVGEHVAQAYFHDRNDVFDQWFLIDDRWASAHPALANALLRFVTRWDVLSTGDERMA